VVAREGTPPPRRHAAGQGGHEFGDADGGPPRVEFPFVAGGAPRGAHDRVTDRVTSLRPSQRRRDGGRHERHQGVDAAATERSPAKRVYEQRHKYHVEFDCALRGPSSPTAWSAQADHFLRHLRHVARAAGPFDRIGV